MRQCASKNTYGRAPTQKKPSGDAPVSAAKMMQVFRKDTAVMAGIRDNSETLQATEMEKQAVQFQLDDEVLQMKPVTQFQSEDDEELQMKPVTQFQSEDDELVQGKFDTI